MAANGGQWQPMGPMAANGAQWQPMAPNGAQQRPSPTRIQLFEVPFFDPADLAKWTQNPFENLDSDSKNDQKNSHREPQQTSRPGSPCRKDYCHRTKVCRDKG